MTLPTEKPSSPLGELSKIRFGGKTYIQERVVSVTTTRSSLVQNNPNRIFWIAINEGVNDVRASTDATLTIASGWLLAAGGGLISMFWEEDGEGVGYETYAISAVAGGVPVRVKEVIRL